MRHRPIRLLIVEDNAGYLELIKEAFHDRHRANKWDLTIAVDGAEALELILGKTARFVPDLILLDWNLPKVSGSEVLQRLKSHAEFRKTPVLVFSSSNAERDIHEAYGHHANGYITKPGDLDALLRIAEAIEAFWVTIAQLTSFDPATPTVRRAGSG